jgi:hypothetical protein
MRKLKGSNGRLIIQLGSLMSSYVKFWGLTEMLVKSHEQTKAGRRMSLKPHHLVSW